MKQLQNFLTRFDLGNLQGFLDIFTGPQQLFLLLVLLLIFLYGMSVGKTRALVSLLGIYVAYMLTVMFPYFDWLKTILKTNTHPGIVQTGLFLGIYMLVFFVLNHSSLKGRLSMGEMSLTQVLLVSLFQIGFLMSIIASFLPRELAPANAQQLYPYISTPKAVFFWAVASVVILPFMKPRRE
ncbi:MAG: hypothetical protein AAB864_00335 [Patescibacteria group bacterium]